jgi:hypothetical protein
MAPAQAPPLPAAPVARRALRRGVATRCLASAPHAADPVAQLRGRRALPARVRARQTALRLSQTVAVPCTCSVLAAVRLCFSHVLRGAGAPFRRRVAVPLTRASAGRQATWASLGQLAAGRLLFLMPSTPRARACSRTQSQSGARAPLRVPGGRMSRMQMLALTARPLCTGVTQGGAADARLLAVETDIAAVERQVKAVEQQLADARAAGDTAEVAYLRTEAEHLRTEEEQLRAEAEQLRAEELILLERQAGASSAAACQA